jgi:hypothetical protein
MTSGCRSAAPVRIGANEKAPRSTASRRVLIVGLVASGCCGFTRLRARSKLQIGQANVARLPAARPRRHVLGSTTISPGRVNVWGHNHRRADSRGRHFRHPATRWRVLREPLFNGVTLLVSIALADLPSGVVRHTRKPPVEVPHGV